MTTQIQTSNLQPLLGKSVWDWASLRDVRNSRAYAAELSDALVERYVYVTEGNRFLDAITGRTLEARELNNLYFSISARNPDNDRRIPATHTMLASHALRRAADMAYRPGHPTMVEENGELLANTWMGLGGKPSDATDEDVRVWTDHIRYLCNNDEDDACRLFDFFACLVQFPQRKIRRMPLIIGEPGCGKDLSIKPFEWIIGLRNMRAPTKDMLMSKFNGWAEHCQFGVCSELLLKNLDEFERIKILCTNDNIEIENKGKDHRLARNHASLMAFSNHDAACQLPKGDRRVDVIRCLQPMLVDEKLSLLLEAFTSQAFCSKLMGWLMARDLSKFNPGSPAIMTRAKEEMMRLSTDPHDGWLDAQLDAGEAPFVRDVVAINDIFEFMRERGPKTNNKLIAMWLHGRGHQNLGQHGHAGRRKMLWAVRDHERYKKAPAKAIWSEYLGQSVLHAMNGAAVSQDASYG